MVNLKFLVEGKRDPPYRGGPFLIIIATVT